MDFINQFRINIEVNKILLKGALTLTVKLQVHEGLLYLYHVPSGYYWRLCVMRCGLHRGLLVKKEREETVEREDDGD
jgi:hypothetical protein